MLSKKHRENEVRSLSHVDRPPSPRPAGAAAANASLSLEDRTPETSAETTGTMEAPPTHSESASGQSDADDDDLDDENAATLDEKIAAARSRLSPLHCLFCTHTSSSFEDNLTHMSTDHSFFIPDAEYFVDPTGLITYLGEKLAVDNVCIYCNGKGREFRTLDAVRKHMVDKSHCKIAYDTEKDMLEISDFYDFSTSYPDAEERQRRHKDGRRAKKNKNKTDNDAAEEGWEDIENDASGDEVDEVTNEPPSSSDDQDEDEDDNEGGGDSSDSDTVDSLPENQITFGDSHLELVLPSGNRIGHRNMRRYYAQSFGKTANEEDDPNSGRSIVRKLLADKHSALVPRKGGFGAFGAGTQVVKARNRGEAREAGRHIREFRDQKRKEDYKTRVGFAQNNQKHFRDPLLQVSFSCLYYDVHSS